MMSQAQLETKVADYLHNSQALQDYWRRLITAEQLQAEMNRIALHTKQPDVLEEFFDALGNDPFVIAECLVRPALAEHLITNSYAQHQRIRDEPGQGAWAIVTPTASYTLPTIGSECVDDSWTATSTATRLQPDSFTARSGPVVK